jgi:hypothetical protein
MRTKRRVLDRLALIGKSLVCVCVLIGVAHANAQVRVYPEFHNRYPSASAVPGAWDGPVGICADFENIVMTGTRSSSATQSAIVFAHYNKASGNFISDLEWPVSQSVDTFEACVAAYDVDPVQGTLARVVAVGRAWPTGTGPYFQPVTVCAYATLSGGLHLEWGGYLEVASDEAPIGWIDPVAVSWDRENDRLAVLCARFPSLGSNFVIYIQSTATGRVLRKIPWNPLNGSDTQPMGVGIDAAGVTVAGTYIVGNETQPRFMRFDLNGNHLGSVFLDVAPGWVSSIRAATPGAEGYNATTFMCAAAELRHVATGYSRIQVATYRYEAPPLSPVVYVETWNSPTGFVHYPEAVCARGAGTPGGEGTPLNVWVAGHTRTALGEPGDIFTVQFKLENGVLVPEWNVVHDDGYPHHDGANTIAFGSSAPVGERLIVGGTVGTGSGDRDYVLFFYDLSLNPTHRVAAFARGPERDPLNPGPPYFNGPNDLAGRVFFRHNTAVFSGWSEHPTTSYDAISELYGVDH